MPANKDSLKRYRIIDQLLSNPIHTYTTNEIWHSVCRECGKISKRMIQKDIKSIEEEFDKKIIRVRGTVKYANQSDPLFYQELTWEEEEILREALRCIGQFDGLDSFTWLDLLKKKLEYKDNKDNIPIISFSKNEGLQMPPQLLGNLFLAITKKKVIKIKYTPFGKETKTWVITPYQLKQFNDRWYLLCGIYSTEHQYDPKFILNLPLDRISKDIEYMEDMIYVETEVDLKARYQEIIGITLNQDKDVEYIYFAVDSSSVDYIRSKWIHSTQIELAPEYQDMFRKKYPSLKDKFFFSIECRENRELYSRFASYLDSIVILEPETIKNNMKEYMTKAFKNYTEI